MNNAELGPAWSRENHILRCEMHLFDWLHTWRCTIASRPHAFIVNGDKQHNDKQQEAGIKEKPTTAEKIVPE